MLVLFFYAYSFRFFNLYFWKYLYHRNQDFHMFQTQILYLNNPQQRAGYPSSITKQRGLHQLGVVLNQLSAHLLLVSQYSQHISYRIIKAVETGSPCHRPLLVWKQLPTSSSFTFIPTLPLLTNWFIHWLGSAWVKFTSKHHGDWRVRTSSGYSPIPSKYQLGPHTFI